MEEEEEWERTAAWIEREDKDSTTYESGSRGKEECLEGQLGEQGQRRFQYTRDMYGRRTWVRM